MTEITFTGTAEDVLRAALNAAAKGGNVEATDLAIALRTLRYMLLPFEPNMADLHAMAAHMPVAGAVRIYAREVYLALARRRGHTIEGRDPEPMIDVPSTVVSATDSPEVVGIKRQRARLATLLAPFVKADDHRYTDRVLIDVVIDRFKDGGSNE